ncbi:hypothetical protein F8P18_19520 [Salmonella enterica]|uniref:hypothetical protein n=1 Tax=Salmonella enterica TaxID=28901 RepID=UPI00124DADBB|nr:hypothetical protein [Salmonella enterica]KAB2508390.1 hypothetical protein F8P18_19520 [Salmonella enterica]
MNKKHTNHHLLKNDIKTESYNMMMHEKSKMRQIPRRCRPVAGRIPGKDPRKNRTLIVII